MNKIEKLKEIKNLVCNETNLHTSQFSEQQLRIKYKKLIEIAILEAFEIGITYDEIGEAIAKGYTKAKKEIGVFFGEE